MLGYALVVCPAGGTLCCVVLLLRTVTGTVWEQFAASVVPAAPLSVLPAWTVYIGDVVILVI